MRERIGQRVKRGKVECALRIKHATNAVTALQIDEGLAESVVKARHFPIESSAMNAARLSAIDVLRWPADRSGTGSATVTGSGDAGAGRGAG